jgi:hypothetical protein
MIKLLIAPPPRTGTTASPPGRPRKDVQKEEPIFKQRSYQQAYCRIGHILGISERAGEVPSSTLFVPFLHLNMKKTSNLTTQTSALLKVHIL